MLSERSIYKVAEAFCSLAVFGEDSSYAQKADKKSLAYRHHSCTREQCFNCEFYSRDESKCHIVKGHVNRQGWCKGYSQRLQKILK